MLDDDEEEDDPPSPLLLPLPPLPPPPGVELLLLLHAPAKATAAPIPKQATKLRSVMISLLTRRGVEGVATAARFRPQEFAAGERKTSFRTPISARNIAPKDMGPATLRIAIAWSIVSRYAIHT